MTLGWANRWVKSRIICSILTIRRRTGAEPQIRQYFPGDGGSPAAIFPNPPTDQVGGFGNCVVRRTRPTHWRDTRADSKGSGGIRAFGKKGVGYHVGELLNNIGVILGIDRRWNIGIVGIGHLGWALANYRNFASMGFHLAALFDQNPALVGQVISGVEVGSVSEMETVIADRNIQIGVITVPAAEAQTIADRMVAAGVHGIWNFAPVRIRVPDSVQLVSEDLSVGLTTLSYHLRQQL
jgi:redox-sensing transcriptional repressor